jgi:hypothetical protein
MTNNWSVYFTEEVKIVFFKYGIPDVLCRIIASFVLGIQYIQAEADKVRDLKIANTITRGPVCTRVMSCQIGRARV